MATPRWLGTALDVADVWSFTIAATWATADTATVTINGKDLTVTVGTTSTVTQVALEIVAMINGAAIVEDESRNETGDNVGEFTDITASSAAGVVTLTGGKIDEKGIPFIPSVSGVTAGNGTIGLLSNTTKATGKNWFDNADNWSTAAVPVQGDDIVVDQGDVSIKYGLDPAGSNLVTNTDAWTAATGTTPPTGWSLVSAANGEDFATDGNFLTITDAEIEQTVTVVGGRRYRVRAIGVAGSNPGTLEVGDTTEAADLVDEDISAGGDFSAEFTATDNTVFVLIGSDLGGADTCIVEKVIIEQLISPDSITVNQGFTGDIGLPQTNEDDSALPYAEYRDQYLKLGYAEDTNTCALTIGEGDGAGSGRIKINSHTQQTTVLVVNSGQRTEQRAPAIIWKGTHASNAATISKGDIGVAFVAGESATLLTLNVGFLDNQAGDSNVECGSGLTLATTVQTGGTLVIDSAATTTSISGGELSILSGAHTTLTIDGGSVFYRSTGTLTTAIIASAGTLDFNRDLRSRTVTNCALHARGTLLDSEETVTWTNGIDVTRAGIGGRNDDVVIDVGRHFTLSKSAI